MLWSISAIQTCMSNIIRVSYLCQYLSVLFVSNTRDSNANEPLFIFCESTLLVVRPQREKVARGKVSQGLLLLLLASWSRCGKSIATGSLTRGWAHRGPRTESYRTRIWRENRVDSTLAPSSCPTIALTPAYPFRNLHHQGFWQLGDRIWRENPYLPNFGPTRGICRH